MSRVNLARYRIEKAREILEDADYGDFVKIRNEFGGVFCPGWLR